MPRKVTVETSGYNPKKGKKVKDPTLDEPQKTYGYILSDEGNGDMGEGYVTAHSIGHAMQKIVPSLPDEEPYQIYIWKTKSHEI